MQGLALRQHAEAIHRAAKQADVAADDPIVRSWLRCLEEYRLDPANPIEPVFVDQSSLRERQQQFAEFLSVVRAGMHQLHRRRGGCQVVLLTDAQGITLDLVGDAPLVDDPGQSGLRTGTDWSELHAGTCGAGTCIAEQRPITVHQSHHFNIRNLPLSCHSAPIFDPQGRLLGTLNLSGASAASHPDCRDMALQMTMLHAEMIENLHFRQVLREQRILRLGQAWPVMEGSGELLVAVDSDGIIVGANSCAHKALLPAGGGRLTGCVLDDLFLDGLATLWRASRSSAASEQLALSSRRGDTFLGELLPVRGAERSTGKSAVGVRRSSAPLQRLAGEDPAMQRLVALATRLADRSLNILVHGETGAGKEVLARALHEASSRADKSFVAVNCAAIPESLIESELFGYTAGAFTGSRSKGMRGLIQQADGGTLLLDEIGDMPLPLQTRLLRVLAEREVLPLGAERPVPVALTVISASHRDLRQLVAEGSFREDLYYRLCGAVLHLPALRERSDRESLIRALALLEAQELNIQATLAPAAMRILLDYHWPGNVRQLRNVLRFSLAVSEDGVVRPEDLPCELMSTVPAAASAAVMREPPLADSGGRLREVLRRHQWNVTAASHELQLARATIYRQMSRYGIVPPNRL